MIEFQNVTKRFGRKTVLDGVDFRIERGETFIVVGRSGAGKSVSLRHMIHLLEPDAGRVLVDGQDVNAATGENLDALLRRFGVLFQSAALIQWLSVLDNVCLPLRQTTNMPEDEILRLANENSPSSASPTPAPNAPTKSPAA